MGGRLGPRRRGGGGGPWWGGGGWWVGGSADDHGSPGEALAWLGIPLLLYVFSFSSILLVLNQLQLGTSLYPQKKTNDLFSKKTVLMLK